MSIVDTRPARGAQFKAVKAWDRGTAERPGRSAFRDEVLPLLVDAPVDELAIATGLTRDYVRRIVAGKVTPHARHWPTLRDAVADASRPRA